MPDPIWIPDTRDRQGSIAERVLGGSEKQRATKTWMPNTILIGRTGLLRNYAQDLLLTFRSMHAETHKGEILSDEAILQRYNGVAAYYGLSIQLDDRLISHRGFGIKAVFGRDDLDQQAPKKDSSAGLEDLPKKETIPTQPAEAGMKMR
jgi:hypothetical protein